MGLIADVAKEVADHLRALHPYQGIQQTVSEGPEPNREIDPAALEAMQNTFSTVNNGITEALNKLTPDTFPHGDPNAAVEMHAFLCEFARSYSVPGRVRSADPILAYLLTSIDHTFWLWRQWISASLAVGDFEAAENLLDAAQESHEFSDAKGHHAHWLCAKAIIYLRRDGDIDLAFEVANRARLSFGGSPESTKLYKALRMIRKEMDATGHHQIKLDNVDKLMPPHALLTGDWNGQEA